MEQDYCKWLRNAYNKVVVRVMFVIKVHCTIHVALTGLEFSFPLAAPFFTGTGRELNSIGWCYNKYNAGQGLTPLFQEKGDFSWVLKPGFNLHTVDTCGTHLTEHFIISQLCNSGNFHKLNYRKNSCISRTPNFQA